jgi:hypothetical protein
MMTRAFFLSAATMTTIAALACGQVMPATVGALADCVCGARGGLSDVEAAN